MSEPRKHAPVSEECTALAVSLSIFDFESEFGLQMGLCVPFVCLGLRVACD